jgi:hypothetical protein
MACIYRMPQKLNPIPYKLIEGRGIIGETRFKITIYLLHIIYFITVNAIDNCYKYMTMQM